MRYELAHVVSRSPLYLFTMELLLMIVTARMITTWLIHQNGGYVST